MEEISATDWILVAGLLVLIAVILVLDVLVIIRFVRLLKSGRWKRLLKSRPADLEGLSRLPAYGVYPGSPAPTPASSLWNPPSPAPDPQGALPSEMRMMLLLWHL